MDAAGERDTFFRKGDDSNEIQTASQSLKVRPKIGQTEIRQSTNKESINRYLFERS